MTILEQMLEGAKSVVVLGHVRPDGDCLGSAPRLYNYLRLNHPDIWAAVYLEESSPKFNYLEGYDKIRYQVDDARYELCVRLDSDDVQRLGDFKHCLDRAGKSLCLDHYVANTRYGGINVAPDEASSICEVLLDQLDEEKIDRHMAECLYTGIIHDTGVLKFSRTSVHTMEVAEKPMEKGTDLGAIIDNSFYRKTYIQNQILGRAFLESITLFDGRCIFSVIRQSEMEFYGVGGKDLNSIIDQLHLTKGVEVTIFVYEAGAQEFKVSMRSRYLVNVSRIAAFSGGGDHVRAAGCTMSGSIHDVIDNLSVHIVGQLDAVPDGQK